MIAAKLSAAFFGACVGAEIVCIPAAIEWGHNGPFWPVYVLVPLAIAGAIIGWVSVDRVRL